MSQYGVLVYSHAPADPAALSAERLEELAAYPQRAKDLGAKVLGATYYASHKGFAFEASTEAVTITADGSRTGPMHESGPVTSAFFVLSAPDMDTAVRAAAAHPDAGDGGIEVRPLFTPPA